MPSFRPSLPRAFALLVVLSLAAGLAGCGTGTGATTAPSAATPTVSGAWVRPPIGADRPAAAYLTITNPGREADALVAVTSPMAMTTRGARPTMDSSGMAGMHPIQRLEIPAGGVVKLEPGGYHVMLMEPKELTIGSTVELTLEFEHAGRVTVQAEVREG